MENTNVKIEQLLSASRAIYIIDATGILLHHEFFLGQQEDPDLYSGLFAAVNVYAKELKAGKIKSIRLKDNKFVFKELVKTNYMIVLDIDVQMNANDGAWLLDQITKRFDAMKKLMADDFKGSLTLETLFEERGKEINWNTIHSIREDAIALQNEQFDNVETLNLTRINIKNRMWVKIRNMISSVTENQVGLVGSYLFIAKNSHLNELYSGKNKEALDGLYNYMKKKVETGIGLELESEMIKVDELFCAIYPMLLEDGGIMSIASEDKYLIARLNNQMERLVAAIEKLGIGA